MKKFTLIELLVVVAIIGILASMLMPSLSRAREKAKVALCINNLKQLSTALHTYGVDSDDISPTHSWYSDFAGPAGQHGWGNQPASERPLNAFLDGENTNITECPSDIGETLHNRDNLYKAYGSSYVVQYAATGNFNFQNTTNNRANTRISLIGWEDPAKKIVFSNETVFNNRQWEYSKNRWHKQNKPRYPTSFIDGHVENFSIWWKESNTCPGGTNISRDGYY